MILKISEPFEIYWFKVFLLSVYKKEQCENITNKKQIINIGIDKRLKLNDKQYVLILYKFGRNFPNWDS